MDAKKLKLRIENVLRAKGYRPMTVHELAVKLEIPPSSRTRFFNCIDKMKHNGQITVSKDGRVVAGKGAGSVEATIISVVTKGGFARPTGAEKDIFIGLDDLGGAMPSDVVRLKVSNPTSDRPRGVVLSVEKRGFVEFAGIFHRLGKIAYIVPDAKYKGKIRVSAKEARMLEDGDMVFAKMKSYSGKKTEALAEIIESYGSSSSARACCQAILDKFHARKTFPAQVVSEALAVSKTFEIGPGRKDLRDMPILTIDGAYSKDLDDAVSVELTETGYRLGVHIADVSHYVTPRSQLDEEAFERGTSIYFGNTVIPMLPKELSNGICSLNPSEDRLTFSAFMEIDADGTLRDYRVEKSVICSRVKGVYGEVNRIFAGEADEELLKKYEEVLPSLKIMQKLAIILREARFRRGAFDFNTDESELVIDENGVAVDVKRRERGESERLIEEFMLLANESVASLAFGKKLPFVYRVHEEPELGKLNDLAAALRAAGFDARAIKPGLTPSAIKAVLEKIKDSPKEKALSSIILRSMSKARYSPDCIGHFGLSLKFYSHFTSPIRRYPDLAIHRILSEMLTGASSDTLDSRYKTFSSEASLKSSEREVAAMQIEWNCEDAYKAEYMTGHIGEQFKATVSSVKSFGMYVMLENTVEGLVKIENLPGWFDYDEQSLTLRCAQNGASYAIGDAVSVILAAADVPTGKIDFTLL